MDNIIQTKTDRVLLVPDTMPENPRDGDNFWHFHCVKLSRSEIGDTLYDTVADLGFATARMLNRQPIILLDHSGLFLSRERAWPFNCRWDAQLIGYAEQIVTDTQEPLSILDQELDAYTAYLNGHTYGLVHERLCCACGSWVHEDSTFGFYGVNDYADLAADYFDIRGLK